MICSKNKKRRMPKVAKVQRNNQTQTEEDINADFYRGHMQYVDSSAQTEIRCTLNNVDDDATNSMESEEVSNENLLEEPKRHEDVDVLSLTINE